MRNGAQPSNVTFYQDWIIKLKYNVITKSIYAMRTRSFLFLLLSILFTACSQETEIVGLWEVKEVKVGDQIMTPNAKWTKFNSDFTQQSGNGWLQHTKGSWDLKENQLEIINTNGLEDPFGAFKVQFNQDSMFWEREEEGEKVVVSLIRTKELPMTYGDQLFGLWKLNELNGLGPFYDTITADSYLFLRWDRKFVLNNQNGKTWGVYNVHGHRSELELIPYGEKERSFWRVSFGSNSFEMELLNSDSVVTRSFNRISDFPK